MLRPAWRWLILVGVLAALILVALALRSPSAQPALRTPTASAAVASPTPTPPAPPPPLTPTPSRTPTRSPTPAPQIAISAATSPLTITFSLQGQIPAGADRALLWYDTIAGHTPHQIDLNGTRTISVSVTITPTQEGLTRSEALGGGLDYWWAVQDRAGTLTRRAASVSLPDSLAALAHTAPITAPAQLNWIEQATPHFRLYAPPGTAAERDLGELARVAEASYDQAATLITATQPVSIPVYLVPRVFWQGGVTYGQGEPVLISYLDRNYAGIAIWSYLVHEVTHALSNYLVPRGGEVGGVLGEGVAVYATGGHYGLEPIDAWAAALAASPRYIPLCQLRYDFYSAQHEIAYQEGASFVGFLIRTYGLETFKQIYKAQQAQRGNRKIDSVAFCASDNQQIVAPTGKTAGALEQAWLAYLKTIQPTAAQRQTWELTIRFFDTMRRYQETLDRPARDLPPPPKTWDRKTAANFLNAATGRRAAVLESMLGAAEAAVQQGDVAHATELLDAIEHSLAADGAPVDPPAHDYDAIAGLLDDQARALRIGDTTALSRTLATTSLAAQLPFTASDLLRDLRYTLVTLDVRGVAAEGVVAVDGADLAGKQLNHALYHVSFRRSDAGWTITGWAQQAPQIELPPGRRM
jgi:hypothetical protein